MEQRSPEWFEARRGKVTASRVVDILPGKKGFHLKARVTYMLELLAERLTGEVADNYESFAMREGTEFEPLARSEYEALYGTPVEEVGFIDHPKIKNFGASPDGLVGKDGGLEIKCPKSKTHITVIKGFLAGEEFDSAHIVQMQVGILCSGRKWWDYVNYDPRQIDNLALLVKRMDRDDALCAQITAEVTLFLAELDVMEAEYREIDLEELR